MAEIVNLRMARKRKTRADAEKQAEANRLQHGRSKSEKQLTKAEKALQGRQIDAHKRQE